MSASTLIGHVGWSVGSPQNQDDFQLPESISLDEEPAGASATDGSGRWQELRDAFWLEGDDPSSLLSFVAFLILGAVLAVYLRFLYRRASRPLSSDSIAHVFPLLTLVTIAVISVVKVSLALSLGLVGALSIVRFRAAIKDPEELVYLFLCIGVGLALGAAQPWIALALVAVATVFVLVVDRVGARHSTGDAYLTIVGGAGLDLVGAESGALAQVQGLWPRLTVHRCDVDGEEAQLRVQLHRVPSDRGPRLVADLNERLPDCQISFVNADALG